MTKENEINFLKTVNVKVSNMTSKAGNDIPNQIIIKTPYGTYFQSYNSLIAFRSSETGQIYLDSEYWDYSVTTGKYRNHFLNQTKKETQADIDAGIIILVNLN